MALHVEATYVNGVLKPVLPLPLQENERVQLVIHTQSSRVRQTQGLIPWAGDPADLEYLAESPDLELGEPR